MAELRKTARQKQMSAIVLENELSDLFDLIKVTHQIASHGEDTTRFKGDYHTALFASVSFLREKADAFETQYYGLKTDDEPS